MVLRALEAHAAFMLLQSKYTIAYGDTTVRATEIRSVNCPSLDRGGIAYFFRNTTLP